MSKLQVITDPRGRAEYVLVPVEVYEALREEIEEEMEGLEARAAAGDEYEPFDPADYLTNPVAVARLRASVKQQVLAAAMGVSQAYLSKLEHAPRVSEAALAKVCKALDELNKPA